MATVEPEGRPLTWTWAAVTEMASADAEASAMPLQASVSACDLLNTQLRTSDEGISMVPLSLCQW